MTADEERAEDLDTARIVSRIQAGDREAFAILYQRYFERVYGYLRVALKDRHEAEDLTQQAFAQVLANLPRYERRRQPFRAWLFVIVRNLAVRELRARARTEVVDPAALDRHREAAGEAPEPELPALGWLSDPDLLILVERLPPVQRQVLVLRFMLGLSTAEVGEMLGRGPNDIAVLQYRALEFLRKRLESLGRTPERRDRDAGLTRWPKQAQVLRHRRFALGR